jgi:cytochrome c biogenesis protein CcdA
VTHLPYVASAYALGLLVPIVFGATAWTRAAAARRRLAAIDPRAKRAAPIGTP